MGARGQPFFNVPAGELLPSILRFTYGAVYGLAKSYPACVAGVTIVREHFCLEAPIG